MNREIKLTVYCGGESIIINTYPNEYRNLMMLIWDKIYIDEFGDCLGMGKCGTCLIEIVEMPLALSFYERNEEKTIRKAGISNANLRLSCQILVDEAINGLKLKIIR